MPNNAEEVYSILKSGNNLYFIIPKKLASSFKRQTERINFASFLRRSRSGVFSRVKAFIYTVYVGLIGFYISYNEEELRKALLVYEAAWRDISMIDGKDLPDGMCKIILEGKKSISGIRNSGGSLLS